MTLQAGYDRNLLPGQGGDEYVTQENQIWWGRIEQQLYASGIIAAATVDSGNTGYTTTLRRGLAMGVITASKKYTQWNPYATDGSHRLVGFYDGPGQLMTLYGGATADRQAGDILVGGNLYADKLIIPGETTKGISGKAYEFLLREAMIGRFNIADDPTEGGYSYWKTRELAASATATVKDHRTHFTNLGAAGAVTLTLPAPLPGLEFLVTVVAAQDIVLASTSTGQFLNGASSVNGDTLTAANRETIRVFGIRTAATPTYQYKMERVPA